MRWLGRDGLGLRGRLRRASRGLAPRAGRRRSLFGASQEGPLADDGQASAGPLTAAGHGQVRRLAEGEEPTVRPPAEERERRAKRAAVKEKE